MSNRLRFSLLSAIFCAGLAACGMPALVDIELDTPTDISLEERGAGESQDALVYGDNPEPSVMRVIASIEGNDKHFNVVDIETFWEAIAQNQKAVAKSTLASIASRDRLAALGVDYLVIIQPESFSLKGFEISAAIIPSNVTDRATELHASSDSVGRLLLPLYPLIILSTNPDTFLDDFVPVALGEQIVDTLSSATDRRPISLAILWTKSLEWRARLEEHDADAHWEMYQKYPHPARLCWAADLGHAGARNELGNLYYKGEKRQELDKDWVRAYLWYRLAGQAGYLEANEAAEKIGNQLTQPELAEAERLLSEWKPGWCERDMGLFTY